MQFQIYYHSSANIDAPDIGRLPPATATDYDFDRSARPPPILRTALTHYVQHPTHAPRGLKHFLRMPKKLGAPLFVDGGVEDEREGWGLRVCERVCWRLVQAAAMERGAKRI